MAEKEIALRDELRIKRNWDEDESTGLYEAYEEDDDYSNIEPQFDEIKKASHYNNGVFEEVLEMMKKLFPIQDVLAFCKLNAFKYRMRLGYKDDAQKDIQKALQYEEIFRKLKQEYNA
jgi:hypothetical protein